MFKKMFKKDKAEAVMAHATGQFVKLEDVPDPVFSQKMMGEGIAVKPTSGTVVAPVAGEIIQIADTLHAFGIRSEIGQEILVHIGLETVALKGEGFKVLVSLGDKVTAGQPIVEADLDFIEKNASSTVIPMVVTNSMENKYDFDWKAVTDVVAGETVVFESKAK